jgi:hypothetical protein
VPRGLELNLAHSTRLIGSPLQKVKSAMAMSIRSVACGSCLISMSIICCILGRSEVADFHLLQSDWENDKELDTKVDAAIEDGDSLCRPFCPDSLVDHIAAKVLAMEMDDELLILVCELVRGYHKIIISICSIENKYLPINSCSNDTILLLLYFFIQVILSNHTVVFSICL